MCVCASGGYLSGSGEEAGEKKRGDGVMTGNKRRGRLKREEAVRFQRDRENGQKEG